MSKLLTLIIAPLFVFLAACGGNDASSEQNNSSKTPSTSLAPATEVDLEDFLGTWVTADMVNETAFLAEITENKIVIHWSKEDYSKNGVYWVGTFPLLDPKSIVSIADEAEMAKSEIASGNSTKAFVYRNDHLEFEFRYGIRTQTIHLKKENS
jgi:hypothetical protein